VRTQLLAATVALAAAAGCGTQTLTGDTTLPPLQLSDGGTTTGSLAPVGIADSGAGGAYVVRTTLPTGKPAPAPVWRLPRATSTDARRLAEALGVSDRPVGVSGGWVARSDGHRLAVRADGSWTWAADCTPDLPIAQESLDVGCGVASTTPAVPAGPTDAAARALAEPILSRIGWADATLDVIRGAPATTVTAHRSVQATPTADWTTTLSFGANDTLTDASGWFGDPTRGRAYPLVDAARAFGLLAAQPRAMPELCQVRKDGKPGCEPIPPVVITGAALGLALRHDLGHPLLVPAWLFAVRGSAQPLVMVAVDPRWLKPPASVVPLPRGPAASPNSVTPGSAAASPR
jgi:hypothetical protein